jgi:leucyl-tRNA synthetase
VPEDQLPVTLPDVENYQPSGTGESPLALIDAWVNTPCPACGARARRETNTMPQWAGSSWYYLRYIDPRNAACLVAPDKERYWMPVDVYVGGAEHAVLHLLYARFWHKVLFDRGYVSTPEPFIKLVNQGMILGEMEFTASQDASGRWVNAGAPAASPVKLTPDQVEKQGEAFVLKADRSIKVESRAYKMSKSRGNVVNPDAVVADHGADSLRLYEMFMGPLEAVKPWSMQGVEGVSGFLQRVWRMILDDRADEVRLNAAVHDCQPTAEQNRMLHRTIQAVTRDVEQLSFNTAIARMMEFTNYFLKSEVRPRRAMEGLVLLLSPFAPHIAEELWQALGHEATLAYEPWPEFDEAMLREDTIEIPVQVNGKLRAVIQVPADADQPALEQAARAQPKIAEILSGKTVHNVIVVPKRMVNFVVK